MRKGETETVIRWDSEQKIVTIDSYHPAVWRRLEHAGYAPTLRRQLDGREVGRRYTMPLERFRFRFIPLNRARRVAPRTAFGRKLTEKMPVIRPRSRRNQGPEIPKAGSRENT